MSLFGTERENRLEAQNESLVKTINKLRSEYRLKDSNHAVAMTHQLADHQSKVADLEAEIQVLESAAARKTDARNESVQSEVDRRVKSFKAEFTRQNAQDIAAMKKELKAEYESKVASLEKSNKELVSENGKYTGHVKGFEETNKVLKEQLASTSSTLSNLITAVAGGLPTVSAHLTTPVPAPVINSGKGQEQKKPN
jgi:chromosome segregation ATPase